MTTQAQQACPKCGLEVASDVVICPACDFIIDSSFLGDDILNADDDVSQSKAKAKPKKGKSSKRKPAKAAAKPQTLKEVPTNSSANFGEDAIILGGDEDEFSSFATGQTGLTREVTQAQIYVGGKTAALLRNDAILKKIDGLSNRSLILSPYERHALNYINGKRPVGRIRRKSQMQDSDLKLAIAMLADKGLVVLKGHVTKEQKDRARRRREERKRKKTGASDADATAVLDVEGADLAEASGRKEKGKRAASRRKEREQQKVAELDAKAPATAARQKKKKKRSKGKRDVDDGAQKLNPGATALIAEPMSFDSAEDEEGGVFAEPTGGAEGEMRSLWQETSLSYKKEGGAKTPKGDGDDSKPTKKRRSKKKPTAAQLDAGEFLDDKGTDQEDNNSLVVPPLPKTKELEQVFEVGPLATENLSHEREPDPAVDGADGPVDAAQVDAGLAAEFDAGDTPVGPPLPPLPGADADAADPQDAVTLNLGQADSDQLAEAVAAFDEAQADIDAAADGFATPEKTGSVKITQGPSVEDALLGDAENIFAMAPGAPIAPAIAPAASPIRPSMAQAELDIEEDDSDEGAATDGEGDGDELDVDDASMPKAGGYISHGARRKARMLFEEAQASAKRGNYSAALMNARLAVIHDPTATDYERAIRAWERIGEDGEQKPHEVLLFEEAKEAEGMGKFEDALELLDQALAIAPNAAALHNRRAVILATRLSRFQEASTAILKACELAPNSLAYKNNLGKILVMEERRKEQQEGKKKGLLSRLLTRSSTTDDDDGAVKVRKIRPKQY